MTRCPLLLPQKRPSPQTHLNVGVSSQNPTMELLQLQGRELASAARPEDYIRWAESELQRGAESDALAVLAGLDLEGPPDSVEVKEYFRLSLKELDLDIAPSPETALRAYATEICESVLDEDLEPLAAVGQFTQIYRATNYASQYSLWDLLDDDISIVQSGYSPFHNRSLERGNINRFVKLVAGQYIKLLEADLPSDFWNASICTSCGLVGESATRRAEKTWLPEPLFRLLFRRRPYHRFYCSHCDSLEVLSMSDYDGRERYLNAVES